jgi:hypothetical protein
MKQPFDIPLPVNQEAVFAGSEKKTFKPDSKDSTNIEHHGASALF